MLLYLVKFYPTIGQLIDRPTENIPNNLAVGEFGNSWLVSSCWEILFSHEPLSISITQLNYPVVIFNTPYYGNSWVNYVG